MACPRCGGEAKSLIAPNYWRCHSTERVSEVVMRPVLGAPPHLGLFEPHTIYHDNLCTFEYAESSGEGGSVTDTCACGTYAIGRCLTCGKLVCGIHSAIWNDQRMCRSHIAELDGAAKREAELLRVRSEVNRAEARAKAKADAERDAPRWRSQLEQLAEPGGVATLEDIVPDEWIPIRTSLQEFRNRLQAAGHPGVDITEVSVRSSRWRPGNAHVSNRTIGRGWLLSVAVAPPAIGAGRESEHAYMKPDRKVYMWVWTDGRLTSDDASGQRQLWRMLSTGQLPRFVSLADPPTRQNLGSLNAEISVALARYLGVPEPSSGPSGAGQATGGSQTAQSHDPRGPEYNGEYGEYLRARYGGSGGDSALPNAEPNVQPMPLSLS